jgi:hypothetical protein
MSQQLQYASQLNPKSCSYILVLSFESYFQEAVMDYSMYSPSICLAGLRETIKPSLRIASVMVKIQTQHLLNTSLECFTTPICSTDQPSDIGYKHLRARIVAILFSHILDLLIKSNHFFLQSLQAQTSTETHNVQFSQTWRQHYRKIIMQEIKTYKMYVKILLDS